ncbi:MAG: hypothetical protein ACKOF3_02410, partial [Spartobacteria bacterium]
MNTTALHPTYLLQIRIAVLLALAASAALAPQARAQTWTGTTDGNWGTAANWGGSLPAFSTSTDIVFGASNANTSSSASPSFLGTSARTIRSLTFNASADADVFIRLTDANGSTQRNLTLQAASGDAGLTVESGATGNYTIGSSTHGSVILGSNLTVSHDGTGT